MGVQTVLVVDDERSVLAAAERTLRQDYDVLAAADAPTALACVRTRRPDLAIVDLRLGTDSGLELVQALLRESPSTIVVLYSGYVSIATAVAATRAGVHHVLAKPITFPEILRRVTAVNDATTEIGETPTLARVEWDHIHRVLEDCHGNISEAARRLGIYRSSLQRKLRKLAPPR
jgi:two-component system response regulator RegA